MSVESSGPSPLLCQAEEGWRTDPGSRGANGAYSQLFIRMGCSGRAGKGMGGLTDSEARKDGGCYQEEVVEILA